MVSPLPRASLAADLTRPPKEGGSAEPCVTPGPSLGGELQLTDRRMSSVRLGETS